MGERYREALFLLLFCMYEKKYSRKDYGSFILFCLPDAGHNCWLDCMHNIVVIMKVKTEKGYYNRCIRGKRLMFRISLQRYTDFWLVIYGSLNKDIWRKFHGIRWFSENKRNKAYGYAFIHIEKTTSLSALTLYLLRLMTKRL